MNRHKMEKAFDCVTFKRQAQAEIYDEVKGLSPEEEIEYFRRRVAAGPFAGLWNALERRSTLADETMPPSAWTENHRTSAK